LSLIGEATIALRNYFQVVRSHKAFKLIVHSSLVLAYIADSMVSLLLMIVEETMVHRVDTGTSKRDHLIVSYSSSSVHSSTAGTFSRHMISRRGVGGNRRIAVGGGGLLGRSFSRSWLREFHQVNNLDQF
jgi:hypothetical protein